ALLLYGLVRATRPRTILEFGTAAGFSSSNWLHAVADDPDARVFSFDIVAHPVVRSIEDTDPRFAFVQKSQTDFEPRDVEFRVIDVVLFDAGHLVEYSLRAFERVLPRLSPTAIVAVPGRLVAAVARRRRPAPSGPAGRPRPRAGRSRRRSARACLAARRSAAASRAARGPRTSSGSAWGAPTALPSGASCARCCGAGQT
ncbi:unnamed protein product, partial [Prorocentrum cordatum]